ncbi:MAG: LLM class flavin-dependent oxidoreductase [Conexibacteraceae bacterium]|nr:LLM class flavin-dependent oxidoreductase [Conexibacteraceae bacterium]
MSSTRLLHLNAFLHDIGHHEAAWRLPESNPYDTVNVEHYIKLARIAEAGRFDSIFFADSPSLQNDPRYRPIGLLEPTTLLAALAVTTERIGLIATASSSYGEPFELARKFSSIDHISGGRAGWNIVTTASRDAALNYGLDDRALHADRYERAEEFVQVAKKLWDSWEDDAQIGDKQAGIFADGEKIHRIDHTGKYYRVAGPLNAPRSPQGHPLLVQAGQSEAGRGFAARHAEAVFTTQRSLADAQAFYADMKRRAVAAGRTPEQIVILPGIVPILGSTEAEARERQAAFDEQIIPRYGLFQISKYFDVDLTGADLDSPLPEVPEEDQIEGFKSRSSLVANLARGENLTVRQLLAKLGWGRGHRSVTGTPQQLADNIESWFAQGAADGFNIMAPALPADLEAFAEHVIPELQRRGLFRREYEGATLREHYGVARPHSQYARGELAGVA